MESPEDLNNPQANGETKTKYNQLNNNSIF
jgi:hypothetical protein